MRKVRYYAAWALISTVAVAQSAHAQETSAQYHAPYYPPSQSSVYNQNSVYLPTPPIAQGQDIVRGASGVSCQSAVASGGPYVDIGLISAQDVYNRDTAAFYGRIVVPLGKRPERPDCTKLYELEIARLRLELELLRMGLPPGIGAMAQASVSDVEAPQTGSPMMIDPQSAARAHHAPSRRN